MKIIALTGKMGSGKTTALKHLQTLYLNHTYLKFAQPIYDAQRAVYESLGMDAPADLKDRRLLQLLGTEWGREKDTNFWVNIWKDRVNKAKGVIITDDCRFLNEAKAIKELGGTIIKINGPQRGGYLVGQDHPSEMEIDLITHDIMIDNTGSIEDLHGSLEFACSHVHDDNFSIKRRARL